MFYRLSGMQYTNPFIWMVCPYDSIYNMLTNFHEINWGNIHLTESMMKPNTFILNVDNQVDIHYVHYIFNPLAKTMITASNEHTPISEWHSHREYCRIWEYIIDRYLSRVRRMIANKEEPIFLLRDEDYAKSLSKRTMHDLCDVECKYKRYIITMDCQCNRTDSIVTTVHPMNIELPYATVSKYLPNILQFIHGCN